jgi:hypothetical protein
MLAKINLGCTYNIQTVQYIKVKKILGIGQITLVSQTLTTQENVYLILLPMKDGGLFGLK